MVQSSEPGEARAASDLALVRKVLAGSGGDLPLLAERLLCVPRLLQALDRRSGGRMERDELADLAQDVLVLVWRKLGDFAGLGSLEGWVFGLCALEYRNALRKQRRLREEAQLVVRRQGLPEPEASDPDPWAHEDVHACLRRIGRVEAEVIRLKHFEGLTFEEIGRALAISANTAKTRYYRGLEELRPLLEPGGAD